MDYYGAKHLAESFRTVRRNTIAIAEEIPADKYEFRAAPGTRTVAEQFAHLAVNSHWQLAVHGGNVTFVDFEMFGRHLAQFSTFLDSLDEARR